MSDKTNFTKLDRTIADIKLWKEDLKGLEDGELKTQLLFNVAPMLEGIVAGVGSELAEQATLLALQAEALEEVIDQEGDFLQPETANNITQTLLVGLSILEILDSENVSLSNELMDKRLRDAAKIYRNNTTILLEVISEITNEDEDDTEDGIPAESESSKGTLPGGEGSTGTSGGDGGGSTGDGTGTPEAEAEAEVKTEAEESEG